jgi:hypothetical protein
MEDSPPNLAHQKKRRILQIGPCWEGYPCRDSGTTVGLYLGAVEGSVDSLDGRWCVGVPGFRHIYSLDSKVSKDWPLKRFLAKRAVGIFFNSSRLYSAISSPDNANCKLVNLEWFYEHYGPETIHGQKVYALLITTKPVRCEEEFLWNYSWI